MLTHAHMRKQVLSQYGAKQEAKAATELPLLELANIEQWKKEIWSRQRGLSVGSELGIY